MATNVIMWNSTDYRRNTMKTLAKIAVIVSAVLMLFSLLTGALYRVFIDKGWVQKEYVRLNIEEETGWSPEYCTFVLGSMMDYSIKKRSTLEDVPLLPVEEGEMFFNESELSHMKDVRALTVKVLNLGFAALIIGTVLLLFAFLVLMKGAFKPFSKAFLIALGVLLLIVIGLGIWMAVDFDSFWTAFHIVFLDLESSTFDPAVSNMIKICPAELFFDIIKHFALIAGLGLLGPVIFSIVWVVLKSKNLEKPLTTTQKIALVLQTITVIGALAGLIADMNKYRGLLLIPGIVGSLIMVIGRKNQN
jgi:integral membrane protein (TIGR01906 family)